MVAGDVVEFENEMNQACLTFFAVVPVCFQSSLRHRLFLLFSFSNITSCEKSQLKIIIEYLGNILLNLKDIDA